MDCFPSASFLLISRELMWATRHFPSDSLYVVQVNSIAPNSRAGKNRRTFAKASTGKLNAGRSALCSFERGIFAFRSLEFADALDVVSSVPSERGRVDALLALAAFRLSARCFASWRLRSRSSFVLAILVGGSDTNNNNSKVGSARTVPCSLPAFVACSGFR